LPEEPPDPTPAVFRFLALWALSYQDAAELRRMVVFTGKPAGEQGFQGSALPR
jgi:hypothetical protein